MIDLYYWPTPNGHKASIMLEETGLPYRVVPVNILKGEQFEPDFLKISPNNRMPAIVDHDGPGGKPLSLFESGAILIYLAEKTGKFLPEDPAARYETLQWLMFQMGGVGPMFGQAGHFMHYAPEKVPYGIERYSKETHRLYGVLDKRLGEAPYLAGPYSIADMATYPWIRVYRFHEIDLERYPNVKRWKEEIETRPGVQRGTAVLAEEEKLGDPTDEAREALFGAKQFDA
ncbi:MAG: glutathione S-transferase N-terminal domain-containing protein [Alphaproteobacteria bacterium]